MKKLASFFTVILLVTQSYAQGDANRGKSLSFSCVACHSEDGNSPLGMYPKLAGQHEKYLTKSLLEYRKGSEGNRNDPIMFGMVSKLNDQEVEDLAAFFSHQTVSAGGADEDLVALGEKIYRGGNVTSGVSACIACHGPKGIGNAAAGFPSLSGQHAQYLLNALNAYKSGTRSDDVNQIMQGVVKNMTNKEIEAVASYASGLY